MKGKRIGVIACDGNFTFDREPPPMEDIFPTGYVANALIFLKVAEKKLGLFTVMFNYELDLSVKMSARESMGPYFEVYFEPITFQIHLDKESETR